MSGAIPGRAPTRTGTWRQVVATVTRQVAYGAEHRWLDLEVPAGFGEPEPGQFVQILLPPTLSPVVLGRPMSVAGVSRRRGRLTIGFLYAPVGAGTRALAELPDGTELEVLGPLGRGYPLDLPGTPLLVAGGRGVAPLLFAADRLAAAGRRCEFLFGARSRAQLVGLADARARLARMHGKLHLATDDGSRGARGTVVDLLDRVAAKIKGPRSVHACGPHGMLKAVARWGLRHETPSFLAMESVMACGTGVCRGCPLPRSEASRRAFDPKTTPSLMGNRDWAMCCTEGPVFEAHALDWDRVE